MAGGEDAVELVFEPCWGVVVESFGVAGPELDSSVGFGFDEYSGVVVFELGDPA